MTFESLLRGWARAALHLGAMNDLLEVYLRSKEVRLVSNYIGVEPLSDTNINYILRPSIVSKTCIHEWWQEII